MIDGEKLNKDPEVIEDRYLGAQIKSGRVKEVGHLDEVINIYLKK